MYISQQLRKTNIAEYLLYMWQVEDLIRAYDCSLSRIRREYVSQFDYDDDQKEDLIDWYGNLIRMMNEEGVRDKGHIQILRIIVQDMAELHVTLLESVRFPFYTTQYYKALPFIVELRSRGKDNAETEVETCLDALYGLMMLRLQHKEVSPETTHAISEISTLMGMLSDYYIKDKTEGLELN